MSWQTYVDMLKKPPITDVGIYGKDGSLYAADGFLKDVTAEQIKTLAGSSDPMKICGPKVGHHKCVFVKDECEDENSFSLHLKGNKDAGNITVCVGKAKTVIIVAIAPPNTCIADQMFKVIKYLRDNNC